MSALTFINIDKLRTEETDVKTVSILCSDKTSKVLDEFVTEYDQINNLPTILSSFFYKFGNDRYETPFDDTNYNKTERFFAGMSTHGYKCINMYYVFNETTFYVRVYFNDINKSENIINILNELEDIYAGQK